MDPNVKTVLHDVELPEGEPDTTVQVRVRGSNFDQTKTVTLAVGSVAFNITGKEKQKFDIYFDGDLGYSIEIDFDTGDVKLG